MSNMATGPRPSPGKGIRERVRLVAHPDMPPDKARGIEVETFSNGADLLLTFIVQGKEHLLLPKRLPPNRADGLWKTTCFELFLAPVETNAYFEFNFSPSTEWAAYRFDGYRAGMQNLVLAVPPHIERDGAYVIQVDLSGLPRTTMRMGLCAVIEETDGTKSYWALAHAPGTPDFHNRDCFTAMLPAPERP